MDRREAEGRIHKLRDEIDRYRYAYHVLDDPSVTDEIYDSLTRELAKLEAAYPDLVTPDSPTQRVGGAPLKEFRKVRHTAPMLSFNDVFTAEDFRAWFERLGNYLKRSVETELYVELKIDGLAIELVYENGLFVQGSTRGDGQIGEDVTQNLRTVKAIPLRIVPREPGVTVPKKLVVRGEVFITREEFERVNAEQKKKGERVYANPRNIAAGSIRQLDPKVTASRRLDSFEYAIVEGFAPKTHEEEHVMLAKLGFKTNTHNQHVKSLAEAIAFRDRWEKQRGELPYEIDGVVAILNSNHAFAEAGAVGKAPRAAIAYKFSPREATTRVAEIRVQVGRTGALTPVAVLQPVSLGGITITHATLHNFDEIKRLDVRVGDTVVVTRAGDVIPQVQEVLRDLRTGKERPFKMPTRCPVDGSKVVKEGAILRCSNSRCGARLREHLYHFVARPAFNIEGLGPKILDRFLDEGLITDAADLFSLHKGDIMVLKHFGEKSAENIVDEIRAKRSVTLPRFLFSLGILHVGEETANLLAATFSLGKQKNGIAELIGRYTKLGREDLERVSDIGPKVSESIYAWFRDARNIKFLERLADAGVEVEAPKAAGRKGKFAGKTFVLTGTLRTLEREDAKERIRAAGGEVSETVSPKTSYVVVGENPGSKYARARTLSVPVLREEEFLKLLR